MLPGWRELGWSLTHSEGDGPDGPLQLTQLPLLPVRLSRDRSTLQVLDPVTRNWASTCFDNFTEALAQTACRQMGFYRYPAQALGGCPLTPATALIHGLPSTFPLLPPLLPFLLPSKNIGVGIKQNCFGPGTFTYKQHEIQSPKPWLAQELTGEVMPASWDDCEVPVRTCVLPTTHRVPAPLQSSLFLCSPLLTPCLFTMLSHPTRQKSHLLIPNPIV